MDFGPQWPFWLSGAWALLGMVLLVRTAWRHAGAVRTWPAGVAALLLWWTIAILPWWQEAAICTATSVNLPGCDWEYHPAPTDFRGVLGLVVLGGSFQALRLGGPMAALAFSIRPVLLRLRRGTARLPSGW